MKMPCLGFHKWSGPDWQFIGTDTYYWFRSCLRCGKRRKLRCYVSPPSRFVNGYEQIISDDAHQAAMRQAGEAH